MFRAEIWRKKKKKKKDIRNFLSENFHFFFVKFSIYLEITCFRNDNIRHQSINENYNTETSECHYENKPIQIYWKFYHQTNESFQMKNSKIFHISAQNIDCGYSLDTPRRVPTIYVLSRNKKHNVYPCKPQFYYIKVGFKGVKIILRK